MLGTFFVLISTNRIATIISWVLNSRLQKFMKNIWSKADVEQLEKYYAAGKRIKIIAQKLHRSPSAVNKAISRYGLIRRCQRMNFSRRTKFFGDTRQLELNNSIQRGKKFVDVVTLTRYLESKGYVISKSTDFAKNIFCCAKEEIFTVNNVPMTTMNLLLLANKIRIDERQPIFASRDIMWY
jgi:hypothetical protein